MIPKLEFNEEYARKNYLGTDEEFEEFKHLECFDTIIEFKDIEVHFSWMDTMLWAMKGYEDYKNQPQLIDYGYGLTFESVEKYLKENYGDSNPDKFLIEAGLMSFEYEKPWKQGYFIDLSGNDTGNDYWDSEDGEKFDQADIDGNFITFSVYDITKPRN